MIHYFCPILSVSTVQEPRRGSNGSNGSNGSKSRVQGTAGMIWGFTRLSLTGGIEYIYIYDMIWHDMIWHDMIWYDIISYHIISYIYICRIYIYIYVYIYMISGGKGWNKNHPIVTFGWDTWFFCGQSWDPLGIIWSCHAGYPISRHTQVTSSCSCPKNIQILCAHDFGPRKHGNLVVIVFFFPLILSIFFRSSMDDAVGHSVEEFGSAESQRYLRQDSLPGIFGPQIARIRNIDIIEGSFEVKLPTIWTDEKQRWEESEKRREEERRSQKRKLQKKEDPGARKGRKVAKHRVFQWFVAPEGRKVGSLKRRVRSQLARWEMNNCTPLWREAHFEVKMYKAHQVRTTFGSWDVVVRNTIRSQHVQKHHHQGFGPPLDVQMSFGVAGARDSAPGQKWAKTWGFCSIFNYNHHYTTLHSNTLHYNYSYTFSITLNYTTLHYTTLHSTTLHCTTLHDATLHYLPLHYTTLHYIALRYITLHSTTLHYINYNYNYATLHSTTLHYTTLTTTTLQLPYTTFHYTTLHFTTLHYTTLSYATLHCITPHYIPLHYTTLHQLQLQLQLQLQQYYIYTTLHYATQITLPYATLHCTTLHWMTQHCTYNYNCNCNCNFTTLHYTTLMTLHCTTLHYTPLHYTTPHYTTLHYTTVHYSTLHSITPHCTTLHYTTPHSTALH